VISGAPLPAFDDNSTPFWEACNDGELRIQQCSRCARLRMPPGPMCPWCGSLESSWSPSLGTGRVWSYVVPHPPLLPAFSALAPYNVIVVELDDDPGEGASPIRLVGNLVESADGAINAIDPETILIGERVRVVFAPPNTDDEGTVRLPRWIRG
jgi:uncharacterized OB-fold protein